MLIYRTTPRQTHVTVLCPRPWMDVIISRMQVDRGAFSNVNKEDEIGCGETIGDAKHGTFTKPEGWGGLICFVLLAVSFTGSFLLFLLST